MKLAFNPFHYLAFYLVSFFISHHTLFALPITGIALEQNSQKLILEAGMFERNDQLEQLSEQFVSEIAADFKKNQNLQVDLSFDEFENQPERDVAQSHQSWSNRAFFKIILQKLKIKKIPVHSQEKIIISSENKERIETSEPGWFQQNKIPVLTSIIRVGIPSGFLAYRMHISGIPPIPFTLITGAMVGLYLPNAIFFKPLINQFVLTSRNHVYNWPVLQKLFNWKSDPYLSWTQRGNLKVPLLIEYPARFFNWSIFALTLAESFTFIRNEILIANHIPPIMNYDIVFYNTFTIGILQFFWDNSVSVWTEKSSLSQQKIKNISYALFMAGSMTAVISANLHQLKQDAVADIFMRGLEAGDALLGAYVFRENIFNFVNRIQGKICNLFLGGKK